jgi:hypothetical protein
VPEQQRQELPQHEQFEALCTLAAGGLLEGAEVVDFHSHMKECSQCRSDYQDLSNLVAGALPQAGRSFWQNLSERTAKPMPGSRQRFLRRARAEGLVFSRDVETFSPSAPWYFRPITMLAPIAAVALVAVGLTIYHFRQTPDTARTQDATAAQQIAELKRENSALTASLSRLNESIATGQQEIKSLRSQLSAASVQRSSEHGDAARSSSQTAQLLDESRNQEKLLAEARDEAAHSSQLRINDEASMVEQQARITELTNKLRIASATLDQERQLAAAGKDVRELMASRELHVIDVRDTDPNGKPSEAFGRVFLTEGKSLTFYAFDLNEDRAADAKRTFQVWAVPEAGKSSARSLGILHVDAKAQGRWVLRVENPALVQEIGSVFVTAEPSAGGKQPSGEKMLYAYLGDANHP